jgi:hypothetical protein
MKEFKAPKDLSENELKKYKSIRNKIPFFYVINKIKVEPIEIVESYRKATVLWEKIDKHKYNDAVQIENINLIKLTLTDECNYIVKSDDYDYATAHSYIKFKDFYIEECLHHSGLGNVRIRHGEC